VAGEDAFKVEGAVMEALPDGTYWVKLSNGHRVRAFVTGHARRAGIRFAPADKVKLQMSPYDLSEGRIIVENG
jgi:translation initiation factor IF-1